MKKKTKKYVVSLVLVMAMLVSLMPGNMMQVKAAGGLMLYLPTPVSGANASSYTGAKAEANTWPDFKVTPKWYQGNSLVSTFSVGVTYTCKVKLELVGYTLTKDNLVTLTSNGELIDFTGIKLSNCSVYKEGTEVGIQGTYVILPKISTTSDFEVQTYLGGQYLSWFADTASTCDGYYVNIDGNNVAEVKKSQMTSYSGVTHYTYFPKLGVGTHQAYVIPYRIVNNIYFLGTPTGTIPIQGASLTSPLPTAVKINSNYVCIHWQKQSNAVGYYVYANGALIADTAGDSVAYKKKGAASKSYSVAAYYMSGGAKVPVNTSAAVRPIVNKKVSSFNPGPSYYGYNLKCYAHVNKLYYTKSGTSKGKLKIKLSVVNTWRYVGRKVKVKVTFKNHGKTIATQTFNFGKIKPWRRVTKTFTFKKCKTEQDICFATISTKVTSK